jgi:hypothetical protein
LSPIRYFIQSITVYGTRKHALRIATGDEHMNSALRIPGFGNPRLDPFLLRLVDGHLQAVPLAGTLRIARSIADGAVRGVIPIHFGCCAVSGTTVEMSKSPEACQA